MTLKEIDEAAALLLAKMFPSSAEEPPKPPDTTSEDSSASNKEITVSLEIFKTLSELTEEEMTTLVEQCGLEAVEELISALSTVANLTSGTGDSATDSSLDVEQALAEAVPQSNSVSLDELSYQGSDPNVAFKIQQAILNDPSLTAAAVAAVTNTDLNVAHVSPEVVEKAVAAVAEAAMKDATVAEALVETVMAAAACAEPSLAIALESNQLDVFQTGGTPQLRPTTVSPVPVPTPALDVTSALFLDDVLANPEQAVLVKVEDPLQQDGDALKAALRDLQEQIAISSGLSPTGPSGSSMTPLVC
ncbi:hypothetical protein HDU96_003444, partial [Phlyctochytrium bullatum]